MAKGFIEMSLSIALRTYPELRDFIPPHAVMHPEGYFIRFDGDVLELGYLGDEWLIK